MTAAAAPLMAAALAKIELKEFFSIDVRALHEGKNGSVTELPDGRFRIRAKMQHCGITNRNNRVYPAETTWGKHTLPESAFVRRIKARRVTGQLEHPDNGRSAMGLGAIVITDIEQPNKDGEVFGTFETMSTPSGKIVESYVRDGVGFGLSSRGNGSVIRNAKGVDEVQPDFEPVTVDCVLDESTPGAEVQATRLKESAKAILESSAKTLLADAGGDAAKAEQMAAAQTEAAVFRDVLLGERASKSPKATTPPAGFNSYVGAAADGSGHYRAHQTGASQWDVWLYPRSLAPVQIASGLQTYKDAKLAAESHMTWRTDKSEPTALLTGAPAGPPQGVPPLGGGSGGAPVVQIHVATESAEPVFAGTIVYLHPFESVGDATKGAEAFLKAGFRVDQDGSTLAVQTEFGEPAQAVESIQKLLGEAGLSMPGSRIGYSLVVGGKPVLQDNVPEKCRTIEAINNLLATVYDMPQTTVPQEDDEVEAGSDWRSTYGIGDYGEDGDVHHDHEPDHEEPDGDEGGCKVIFFGVEPDTAVGIDGPEGEESDMGNPEPMPVTIQAPMPEVDIPIPQAHYDEMGAGNTDATPPPDLRTMTLTHDDGASETMANTGEAAGTKKKPVGAGRPGGYPDGGQAMPDTEYMEQHDVGGAPAKGNSGAGGVGAKGRSGGGKLERGAAQHGDDGKDHSDDDREIRADDPEVEQQDAGGAAAHGFSGAGGVGDRGRAGGGKLEYAEVLAGMEKSRREYFEFRAMADKMYHRERAADVARHFAGGPAAIEGGTCCGMQHEHVVACYVQPQISEEAGSGYTIPATQLDDPEDLDHDLDWVEEPNIDLTYMEAAAGPGSRRARKVKLSPVALSVFEVLRASSRPLSKSDITGLLVIPDNMWIRALHELHGAGLVGTVGVGPGTRYRAIFDVPTEAAGGLISDATDYDAARIDPMVAATVPSYYVKGPRPVVNGERPAGEMRVYFNEAKQVIEIQEFDAQERLVARTGTFPRISAEPQRFGARLEALIVELKKKKDRKKDDKKDDDKTDEAKKDKKDAKEKDKKDDKKEKDKTDESKKPPLGSGARFAALAKKAKDSGAKDPKAVAAAAGDAKYGKKKMAAMAKAGKHEAVAELVHGAFAGGGYAALTDLVRENLAAETGDPVPPAEDTLNLTKKNRFLQDEVARLEQENMHLNELLNATLEQNRVEQLASKLEAIVAKHPKLENMRGRLAKCETVEALDQEAKDLLGLIQGEEKTTVKHNGAPAAGQNGAAPKNGTVAESAGAAPQNGTSVSTTKTSITSLEVGSGLPKDPISESGDKPLAPGFTPKKSPALGDTVTGRTADYRRRRRTSDER